LSLLAEYRRSLKHVDVEEPIDLVLYRPAAFAIVKVLYRTSITPNQITFSSIFVGLLAGVCFGFGHRAAVAAGAALFALSIVLDCADGQLARLKRNGTRMGRILDGLVDYFVDLSVCIGLAVGLAPEGDPVKWILLLTAVAASYIVHSAVLDFYRNRYLEIVQGSAANTEDEDARGFREEIAALRKEKGRRVRKALLRLYLDYLEIQKRLTLRKRGDPNPARLDPEEFLRRNRAALRGWTFLGGSTANTWFILTVLIGRLDLFFWGIIVVANVWAAIMLVVQSRIDHRLAQEAVT
jgi:phosphatidylglycerophosphate synthase